LKLPLALLVFLFVYIPTSMIALVLRVMRLTSGCRRLIWSTTGVVSIKQGAALTTGVAYFSVLKKDTQTTKRHQLYMHDA
jgi:hypothetical protein